MMEIKILGTGCPKCKSLEKLASETAAELGIDANIIKETDISNIMDYGILRTPGLVINNEIVLSGRLPSKNEMKSLLTQ
jgi:small redox-active disulfide protein 2